MTAATATKRYPAGHATYHGNVARDVVGRLMGPTTFDTYVVAQSATYHPATDQTRVAFSTLLPDDVVYQRDGGPALANLDLVEFGAWGSAEPFRVEVTGW